MPGCAVVGAGSWGTTVAALTCANTPTVLWARDPRLAESIARTGVNERYLPGRRLPSALRVTGDLAAAVSRANVIVMAVPSQGFRKILRDAAPHVAPSVPVVSLAKGLEPATNLRMSEVIAEILPGHPVAVLTGPNLAREILGGQPAASVVAARDEAVASELQGIFSSPTLRVYTNPDVIGCELCGVVKNVIAIAAGMAEGMGFGDNTRAALITRGLAEMTRLCAAMGADPATVSGLAGTGDLIATCSSPQSRNSTVGRELGKGRALHDVIGAMDMVAEGVQSSLAVRELARRHDVEMPLTEVVASVCHEGMTAVEALDVLMQRVQKPELEGMWR